MCVFCDRIIKFKATYKETKHKERRCSCDQRDYIVSNQTNLKHHIESKHEGVRYPCNQSEYLATKASHLDHHKQCKHEVVTYTCDTCEYVTTCMSYFLKDVKGQNIKELVVHVVSITLLQYHNLV